MPPKTRQRMFFQTTRRQPQLNQQIELAVRRHQEHERVRELARHLQIQIENIQGKNLPNRLRRLERDLTELIINNPDVFGTNPRRYGEYGITPKAKPLPLYSRQ